MSTNGRIIQAEFWGHDAMTMRIKLYSEPLFLPSDLLSSSLSSLVAELCPSEATQMYMFRSFREKNGGRFESTTKFFFASLGL